MSAWLALRTTVVLGLLTALAGCGPARISVKSRIPDPQLVALPLTMGLRMPASFTGYVHKETLNESRLEIGLGPPQSDALQRIASRLFEHASVFESSPPPELADTPMPVLEPAVVDYYYVFPTKGSDFYSVTITYRVTLFGPDNSELGSWEYSGYGSVPSRRTGRSKGLLLATAAAIRDASANFAAHLPEQLMIRRLLDPSLPPEPAETAESDASTGSADATAPAQPDASVPPEEPAPGADSGVPPD